MSPTDVDVQQHDLELPTGWARTRFEDIYELAYGKSLTKVARNTDGDYPVYGSNGIVGHHDTFLVDGPALIVGRKGAAGIVSFSAKPCWPIDTTYYVRNSEHINIRFSFYLLTSLRLNQFDRSTAIPGLNRDDAYDLVVCLPPLSEQCRIVDKIEELFSELDKGVESLKAARAQLNAYRQAVLKQAFEGKFTAQWREENKDKLETTEQLRARIKQERTVRYELQLKNWETSVKRWEKVGKSGRKPSKPKKPSEMADVHQNVIALLPELPEGWCGVRVGDCCEVVRGGSPRPADDTRYYNGSIPFLKVADLTRTGGVYLDTHSFTIKEAGLHKTRLVEPPFLMLSNSGATLGVPKVCRIKTTFNDGIAAFLDLDLDDLLYHYYFWASKTFQLRAINQGAAQPNLNTDLIKETVIPLCTHAEMQIVANHIGRLLSMCDQLVAGVESQLLKIDVLRQLVLKKAFSGQLVAQNSHDEPASVILERIKAEREQVYKSRKGGKKTRKKWEGTA